MEGIRKCPLYLKTNYYLCGQVNYNKGVVDCILKLKSTITCDDFVIYVVLSERGKIIALSINEKQKIEKHECPKE
jgi:hypothetical protein